MSSHISNVGPDPDRVLVDIAKYGDAYKIDSAEAYDTAADYADAPVPDQTTTSDP